MQCSAQKFCLLGLSEGLLEMDESKKYKKGKVGEEEKGRTDMM